MTDGYKVTWKFPDKVMVHSSTPCSYNVVHLFVNQAVALWILVGQRERKKLEEKAEEEREKATGAGDKVSADTLADAAANADDDSDFEEEEESVNCSNIPIIILVMNFSSNLFKWNLDLFCDTLIVLTVLPVIIFPSCKYFTQLLLFLSSCGS